MLPPHGSMPRFRQGCTCDACRETASRYDKERRSGARKPHARRWVPDGYVISSDLAKALGVTPPAIAAWMHRGLLSADVDWKGHPLWAFAQVAQLKRSYAAKTKALSIEEWAAMANEEWDDYCDALNEGDDPR